MCQSGNVKDMRSVNQLTSVLCLQYLGYQYKLYLSTITTLATESLTSLANVSYDERVQVSEDTYIMTD